MSSYEQFHAVTRELKQAQEHVSEALHQISGINMDGGDEPIVIGPARFEDAYRALSRAMNRYREDRYDQWTPASQAQHRRQARSMLEAIGFTVQEAP